MIRYGEGYCSGEKLLPGGARRRGRIGIDMCDRDALEPVGRWWGVEVKPRGDRVKVCKNGPAYRIAASGERAVLIVEEMKKCGLSSRKTDQWNKVLRQPVGDVQPVPW
jgi:hypothetical protein